MRERFDLEALDPDHPFELDSGNLPHLAKHAPFTAGDDWLMVARVPGAITVVPLAPSRSGDPTKCRPIGIYEPSRALAERYQKDSTQ